MGRPVDLVASQHTPISPYCYSRKGCKHTNNGTCVDVSNTEWDEKGFYPAEYTLELSKLGDLHQHETDCYCVKPGVATGFGLTKGCGGFLISLNYKVV